MRFKYLFLGLMIFILATSITAISAADDYESLGDYTFDIPDGYHVLDKTDEMLSMQADDNHSVIVYKLDKISDFNELKNYVKTLGGEFGAEESYPRQLHLK